MTSTWFSTDLGRVFHRFLGFGSRASLHGVFAVGVCTAWLAAAAGAAEPTISSITLRADWPVQHIQFWLEGENLPSEAELYVRDAEGKYRKIGKPDVRVPGKKWVIDVRPEDVEDRLTGNRALQLRVIEYDADGSIASHSERYQLEIEPVDLRPVTKAYRIEEKGIEIRLFAENLLPGFELYYGRYNPEHGTLDARRLDAFGRAIPRVVGAQQPPAGNHDMVRVLMPDQVVQDAATLDRLPSRVEDRSNPASGAKTPSGEASPDDDRPLAGVGMEGPESAGSDTPETRPEEKPGPFAEPAQNQQQGLFESDERKTQSQFESDEAKKQNAGPGNGMSLPGSDPPPSNDPVSDYRPPENPDRSVLLYIVGFDGSRSRILELPPNGKGNGVTMRKAIPAPLPELVSVPQVNDMALPMAVDELEEAGLSPQPVDAETLDELLPVGPDQWPTRWVERQGTAADEELPRGSPVLLACLRDDGELPGSGAPADNGGVPAEERDEPYGDKPDGDEEPEGPDLGDLAGDGPPADQPGIDIDDAGGNIVGPGGLGGDGPPPDDLGDADINDGDWPGDDDMNDGMGPGGDDDHPGDPGQDDPWANMDDADGCGGQGGTINIDPTLDVAGKVSGLILRLVFESLKASGDPPPPGVSDVLEKLARALGGQDRDGAAGGPGADPASQGSVDVSVVADLIVEELGVNLTPAERQDFEDRLADTLRGAKGWRNLPADQAARQLLLKALILLDRQNVDPAANLKLTVDPNGRLSVEPDRGGPADWVERIVELLNLDDESDVPDAPSDGRAAEDAAEDEESEPGDDQPEVPPLGEELVRVEMPPDYVNVPDVREQSVRDAVSAIQEAELTIRSDASQKGRNHKADDVVLDQKPSPGWREGVSHVALKIGVRVPDLQDRLLDEAGQIVRERDLRIGFEWGEAGKPQHGPFKTDKVISQQPAPDTETRPSVVEPGTEVAVRVHTRIPDVRRQELSEADEELERSGLDTKIDREDISRSFQPFKSDLVVKQEPGAGEYAAYGSPVAVAVRTEVPDLDDEELAEALEILERNHLTPDYRQRYPRANSFDVVFDQRPEAGDYVKHFSSVEVALKVPVPDLDGTRLSTARQRLEQRDLKARVPNQYAKEDDVVRDYDPEQYARHGTEVTLDPVVTRVPSVVGETLGDAYRMLRKENFGSEYDEDALVSSDEVTAQSPSAGEEYERGKTIQLSGKVRVPDVTRQQNVTAAMRTVRQADGELRPNMVDQWDRGDIVVRQSPRGGTRVNPRTTVRMWPGFYIPDYRGESPQETVQDLNRRDIRFDFTVQQRPAPRESLVEERLITAQSHQGLVARRGFRFLELTLTEFTEPLKRVPNVVGLGPSRAKSKLYDAGFETSFTSNFNETEAPAPISYDRLIDLESQYQLDLEVASQNPSAGTRAEEGSTVKVHVVESDSSSGSEGRGEQRPEDIAEDLLEGLFGEGGGR